MASDIRLFSFGEKNREAEASLIGRRLFQRLHFTVGDAQVVSNDFRPLSGRSVDTSGFSKSICCRFFDYDGYGAGELRFYLACKGERAISTMHRR